MPIYNKLVRDRIPEIIARSGRTFTLKVLDEEEYKRELQKKVREELAEYMGALSNQDAVEELADLLELVHALASVHGFTVEELEEVRSEKMEQRGGFQERLFLIDVED